MTASPDPRTLLTGLSDHVKKAFDDHRSLMSFSEWFCQMHEAPARHLRGASQYVRDVFEHFGTQTLSLPHGEVRRFKLFDAPFANGEGRVAGQEHVQNEIYRLLGNFVRDGRVNRLILLHGPNGSAKSSLVGCVQGGMEAYSQTPEGAMYSYAWIFPSERIEKGRLGFGSDNGDKDPRQSFAYLPADQIDARLPCELRDHPIFLIPKAQRHELLGSLSEQGRLPEDFVMSRYIMDGDLSPRDRAIYDALLKAYDGDHSMVLRHVQVERFYVSLSYGHSLATVEPQMHVDADARQVTADRSVANLPRSLQTVPLYEISGPLIGANRGLLEFSDLLKRPLEAIKYLLTTSEEAKVPLPQFTVFLDEVLIASSNEQQLAAFKEHHDWSSFKGRMELIRVPYLLRYSDEVGIYASQFATGSTSRPMAPHTVEAAAFWAVLTRLRAPIADQFEPPVKGIVEKLTPVEKLRLYDTGELPGWVSARDGRELSRKIAELRNQHKNALVYEGFLGASAREIRTLLLNAASREGFKCLTPLPVLEELEELIKDPSLYPYLTQEPTNGYNDNRSFIDLVRTWWLDLLDDEMRTSMGLVEEQQYEELFAKYVSHISHALKKEKLLDRITGKFVDPDQDLMKEVESHVLAEGESVDDFRKSVISRIGAWGLDNPSQTPNYRELFGAYIEKMEADYYRQQKKQIARILQGVLETLSESASSVEEDIADAAESTIQKMESRFGYPRECTAECAAYLMSARYADLDR